MKTKQSRCDGCFYRFEQFGDHIEAKSGRYIDRTITERGTFAEAAGEKLNMQGAVRLYTIGDEGRLLAMNIRKLETHSLPGNPLVIKRQRQPHTRNHHRRSTGRRR